MQRNQTNLLEGQLVDYKNKYHEEIAADSYVTNYMAGDETINEQYDFTDYALQYYITAAQIRYNINEQQANEFVNNSTLRTLVLYFTFDMICKPLLNQDMVILFFKIITSLDLKVIEDLWKNVNSTMNDINDKNKSPLYSPIHSTPNFSLHMDPLSLEKELTKYIKKHENSWGFFVTHHRPRAESILPQIQTCIKLNNLSVLSDMINCQLSLFKNPKTITSADQSKPKHEQPLETCKNIEDDEYYQIMKRHQYLDFKKK